MIVLTDIVLITAIVQRGTADQVVQAAQEAGARGRRFFTPMAPACARARMGLLGLTINAEGRHCCASAEQGAIPFSSAFSSAAKMDTPGMGILWMTPLEDGDLRAARNCRLRSATLDSRNAGQVRGGVDCAGAYWPWHPRKLLTAIIRPGKGRRLLEQFAAARRGAVDVASPRGAPAALVTAGGISPEQDVADRAWSRRIMPMPCSAGLHALLLA